MLGLLLPAPLDAQRRDTLRVALVLSAVDSTRSHAQSIARGIAMGADEVTRTAALFGLTIEVDTTGGAAALAGPGAASSAHEASALVVAGPAATCMRLQQLTEQRRAVILAIDCASEVFPAADDPCRRIAFRLLPNAESRERARDILTRHLRGDTLSHARVVVWHHGLERFGAAQLNERFRRRFQSEMDSDAWTGWIAMKILGEAALRARTTDGLRLARYLARPKTRFDGHKGEPLRFDQRTGELRQPLYLVVRGAGDERVAAEISGAEAWSYGAATVEAGAACTS
jgi:hypothetical protein